MEDINTSKASTQGCKTPPVQMCSATTTAAMSGESRSDGGTSGGVMEEPVPEGRKLLVNVSSGANVDGCTEVRLRR